MSDDGITKLPDGSAFCVASFPLPKDHWLYAPGYNVPPMGHRLGTDSAHRKEWQEKVIAAARYAVRASTMNGKEKDFDPDALVQNMVVGLLGYYTKDGLDHDEIPDTGHHCTSPNCCPGPNA